MSMQCWLSTNASLLHKVPSKQVQFCIMPAVLICLGPQPQSSYSRSHLFGYLPIYLLHVYPTFLPRGTHLNGRRKQDTHFHTFSSSGCAKPPNLKPLQGKTIYLSPGMSKRLVNPVQLMSRVWERRRCISEQVKEIPNRLRGWDVIILTTLDHKLMPVCHEASQCYLKVLQPRNKKAHKSAFCSLALLQTYPCSGLNGAEEQKDMG